MDLKHFFLWEDYSSTYKLSHKQPMPYLQSTVEVVFTRGLKTLKYKNVFSASEFIDSIYSEEFKLHNRVIFYFLLAIFMIGKFL